MSRAAGDDRSVIEFWFDFTSPYGYFASLDVEAVAARHGRVVLWRPFLLGAVLKTTGMRALTETPLRGDYARRDWARLARRRGVPFVMPAIHPANTVAAGRAALWVEETAPERAVAFDRAVLDAHFGRGEEIGAPEAVSAIAASVGSDRADVAAGMASPRIKERFRARSEAAIARGIFGSPFFVVDGEPFWGADRLPMLDAWLASGGW